ncbi:MAG: hypothetical protein PF545_03300, partial [Elusimicrobia bacterium]|nr:hypothetical protein [Elusimicrobiota bacterium]
LIENLLGWGESAEDIGRSWTANERDMSATGRLLNHYKIPRDKIEKIITQSPNRQKGQSKGSKYFDSLFNKFDKKDIKNNKAITIRGRTTDDILRVFCEAGSLLFSRKPHVAVKLPTDDGSQTEVWRSGWVGGMTRQRAKVLIWALSEAKKKIIITFEAFMEKVIGMKISDYKDERSFRKTAYKTFDRLIRPLVALRFGVGKYYGLDLGSRAREEGVSPFKSFERTADGKVIIELSDEMNIALSDSERLKRISKDFLSFIEKAEQAVTPPLLLWIGENFYDKKNANAQVKLDSEELIKRLQGPRKITNTYAKYFRDEIYKSIKEINNKNLLKLVGTSARKIDVTSNREASEFVFEVSDFKGKNMIKR